MPYLFAGWWVCGLCGARLATGRVQDLLHRLAQSVDSLLERPAEVTSLHCYYVTYCATAGE